MQNTSCLSNASQAVRIVVSYEHMKINNWLQQVELIKGAAVRSQTVENVFALYILPDFVGSHFWWKMIAVISNNCDKAFM